jgi:hypothetical protein
MSTRVHVIWIRCLSYSPMHAHFLEWRDTRFQTQLTERICFLAYTRIVVMSVDAGELSGTSHLLKLSQGCVYPAPTIR